jgi:DNA-binding MarR family transcriptional regulator
MRRAPPRSPAPRPPSSVVPAELHGKPGHLIRRAQQIAVSIFMEECRAFEITPVQYGIMRVLEDHPGTDQISLASLVAIDRSTMGDVAARLEERGLVSRAPAQEDRRNKLVTLTAAGSRLLAAMEPMVEAAQVRILAPLGRPERATFMRLLAKLVETNNDASRAPLGLRPAPAQRPAAGAAPAAKLPRTRSALRK